MTTTLYNLTFEEQQTGVITTEKLARIVSDISSHGFAVVTGLISPESCELLMASATEDVKAVRGLGKPTMHERRTGQGHLQLGLRRYAPYARQDLIANPLIEHVVSGVLGSAAWLGFYNGNVNLPGSGFQPLHFDRPFSWKSEAAAAEDDQTWPPPTTTLSCSVALTDITKDNGATEIYPGTHHETAVIGWPPEERISDHPELMEQWGPPARMEIPAGAICFRDPRMWHRGVPNESNQVRPMIALTYHSALCKHWRGRLVRKLSEQDRSACESDPAVRLMDDRSLGDGRLVFEDDTRGVFDSPDLHNIQRNVKFITPPKHVNHFVDAHLPGGARVIESSNRLPDVM